MATNALAQNETACAWQIRQLLRTCQNYDVTFVLLPRKGRSFDRKHLGQFKLVNLLEGLSSSSRGEYSALLYVRRAIVRIASALDCEPFVVTRGDGRWA